MVRRAAAVLSLAGAWCAWTVLAPRLDQPSTNGMLAAVALVALPLATGIVAALAAGYYDQRRALAVVVGVGWALALAGTLTDYETIAGLGKILGAGALGLLFVGLLEKAWHVAAVAVLVIGVDTYSVFAGPTKRLLESGGAAVSTFTVPISGPGVYAVAGLGVVDFLFLGLFCGAALNWRLRPRLTIPLCMLSFSLSIAVAVHEHRSVPALPLLSLAFVLPNLRRFRPGAPDRPWELRTRPTTTANARRNAAGKPDRRTLWQGAQDAAWPLSIRCCSRARWSVSSGPATATTCRSRGSPSEPAASTCSTSIPRPAARPSATRRGRSDLGSTRSRRMPAAGMPTGSPPPSSPDASPSAGTGLEPVRQRPYDLLVGDLFYSQLLTRGSGTPASPTSGSCSP